MRSVGSEWLAFLRTVFLILAVSEIVTTSFLLLLDPVFGHSFYKALECWLVTWVWTCCNFCVAHSHQMLVLRLIHFSKILLRICHALKWSMRWMIRCWTLSRYRWRERICWFLPYWFWTWCRWPFWCVNASNAGTERKWNTNRWVYYLKMNPYDSIIWETQCILYDPVL